MLSVLNALRHQWFGRSCIWIDTIAVIQCSTPYGISGLADSHKQQDQQAFFVLNALRHQWFGSGICMFRHIQV